MVIIYHYIYIPLDIMVLRFGGFFHIFTVFYETIFYFSRKTSELKGTPFFNIDLYQAQAISTKSP